MRTQVALILAGLLLVMATSVGAGELDATSRAVVTDWARERDQAAMQYLRSWLVGEPDASRVPVALTLLAREAGICAMIRDKDLDLLQRYCLLWGRRVTPETLPVVLMERRGIRFDPVTPFEGKTFSLEGPRQIDRGR